MKQDEIEIGREYQTKINGVLCLVRVTAKRKEERPIPGYRARTLFDWVRVNPPPRATKLRGSDTSAKFRRAPVTLKPFPELPGD